MNDRRLDSYGVDPDNAEDWAIEIMLCCGRHPHLCRCDSVVEFLRDCEVMGYTIEVDREELPIVRW